VYSRFTTTNQPVAASPRTRNAATTTIARLRKTVFPNWNRRFTKLARTMQLAPAIAKQ